MKSGHNYLRGKCRLDLYHNFGRYICQWEEQRNQARHHNETGFIENSSSNRNKFFETPISVLFSLKEFPEF